MLPQAGRVRVLLLTTLLVAPVRLALLVHVLVLLAVRAVGEHFWTVRVLAGKWFFA